ncbi:MAG: hypothetical protein OEZ01_04900 [Candidatus Heimdallarchaeota archaeon]|nr:hypothetical protein [Candidatus Heimdallarchaeota archaeon]MDH5645320.1 hypothetical protein [Candidatus Heimdallarchaeota archaeon]
MNIEDKLLEIIHKYVQEYSYKNQESILNSFNIIIKRTFKEERIELNQLKELISELGQLVGEN